MKTGIEGRKHVVAKFKRESVEIYSVNHPPASEANEKFTTSSPGQFWARSTCFHPVKKNLQQMHKKHYALCFLVVCLHNIITFAECNNNSKAFDDKT